MRQTRAMEIGTGLFVLFGLAALLFMVTQITAERVGVQRIGYVLTAKFDNIGGLKVGAPVSMAGVTIGRVTNIAFDSSDYRARVSLRIDPQFSKIPNDSDAAIFTQGLLGNQYLGMTAGGSETFYKDGDQIELTQSALVLENLISKFLVNFAEGKSKSTEEAK
ncbi:MAG: outer membrane lipid asymmetry maintenance protein MlaD [Steroidobacterales bacterium]